MTSVMELPRTINRIVAFDKQSQRRIDAQGFLHVEGCNISKNTVNPYFGSEIPNWKALGLDAKKIYNVLRPAAELEKAAPTFNNLPLLDGHKAVAADELDDPDLKRYVVGSTGTDAVFDGRYLKNSIVVWTSGAIDGVSTGEQHELSCAYRYDFVHAPGTFEGQAYDGYMTNIVGNHVALVEEGRAGHDVVVADAQPENMMDVDAAEKALNEIDALLKKETGEAHHEAPEQITALRAAINALKKFITSEVEEVKPVPAAHDTKELPMGKPKTRNITSEGHVVRGAILAYLKPRLAADAVIAPGEILTIVKNVAPGRYAAQVDGLVGVVADSFKNRLVEAVDTKELNSVLCSLEPEFAKDAPKKCPDCGVKLDSDGVCPECEEDFAGDSKKCACGNDCSADSKVCADCAGKMAKDDESTDTVDDSPKTSNDETLVTSFATKYNLPQDAMEELRGLIHAQQGITGDAAMPETIVKTEEQPAPEAITQTAMDAALETSRKATIAEVGARFQAAKDVHAVVGDVDALAADSAESIYKMALDAKGVDLTDTPASAFKAIFKALPAAATVETTPVVAADAKSVQDFHARYPHAAAIRKG